MNKRFWFELITELIIQQTKPILKTPQNIFWEYLEIIKLEESMVDQTLSMIEFNNLLQTATSSLPSTYLGGGKYVCSLYTFHTQYASKHPITGLWNQKQWSKHMAEVKIQKSMIILNEFRYVLPIKI